MPPPPLLLCSTTASYFSSFPHQPSSPLSSSMKMWTVWPFLWKDKSHQPGSSLCLSRQGLLPLILFPTLAWSNTSPPNQGWLGSHTLLYSGFAHQNNDSRWGKEEMFTSLQKKKQKEKKKIEIEIEISNWHWDIKPVPFPWQHSGLALEPRYC